MTNRIEIVSNRNNSNNIQSQSQLSTAAAIQSTAAAAQLFLSNLNVAPANLVSVAAAVVR